MNMKIHTDIYRLFLSVYPRSFRSEFGEEMQQVFKQTVEEAAQDGTVELSLVYLRELRDLPAAAFHLHWRERAEQGTHTPEPLDGFPGAASRREIWLALAAFLLPAALILVNITPKTPLVVINLSAVFFMGAAFFFGVSKGLPRWSLPYLGILLAMVGTLVLFNWMADLFSPSVISVLGPGPWSESIRLLLQCFWAGLMWLGLFLLTLIVLGLLAILRRCSALVQRIRQDWTLVSFVIYGEAIFALILLFDEYQREEPYIIASLMLLSAGSWFYLHSSAQWQRVLALLSGMSLAMWAAAFGQWVIVPLQAWPEWFQNNSPQKERWFEAGSTLIEWGWMAMALLTPALLQRIARRRVSKLT